MNYLAVLEEKAKDTKNYILMCLVVALISLVIGYCFGKRIDNKPAIQEVPFEEVAPTMQVVPISSAQKLPLKCQPGFVRVCEAGNCECLQQ